MDQTELRPAQRWVLRWVLSGLVIAGVLAMHILGGHDGAGSEPMAMTPVGVNTSATAMAPMGTTSTDLATMSMAGRAPAVTATATAVDPSPVALTAAAGHGMSDMSCCVLFLLGLAGLVLLALVAIRRRGGNSSAEGDSSADPMGWWRAPPSGFPPRFSLCVLRV